MTDSERLHALAISSKPEWAPVIRERNEWLLEKLELLRPFIGRKVELTDELRKAGYDSRPHFWEDCDEIFCQTEMGCPHCLDADICDECLYVAVCGRQCADVPFGGVRPRGQGLVIHSMDHARIMILENMRLTQQEFDKAHRFLQAHIEWTHDPDWGKES